MAEVGGVDLLAEDLALVYGEISSLAQVQLVIDKVHLKKNLFIISVENIFYLVLKKKEFDLL